MTKKLTFALALLLASTSLLGEVTKVEEFRFELADGGRFSLDNVNGDTVITGVDGNEVYIKATKKAGSQKYLDGMEILIDATETRISVETEHPSGNWFQWGNDGNGSVDYEVQLPRGTELDPVESVNGLVRVTGITAAVRVSTVNGDLELEGLMDDAKLETVNGGIEARFDRAQGDQRIAVDAVNGAIVLYLPADTSARVTAESVNGGIRAEDFGLEAEKGLVGRDLEADIASGEARIDLDTVNGSIRLNKAD